MNACNICYDKQYYLVTYEEEWEWEEVWREREWDEAWETCNLTWHNDMVLTAEEYDRLELTE